MPFVRVARVAELEPDSVREVVVRDSYYALCRAAGRITALGGVCAHRGGPLGHGAIHGNRVVCPWHAWEFDCATGEFDFDPSIRVATYPVEIRGEDIFIDIP